MTSPEEIEERNQTVFNRFRDFVYLLDLEGNFIEANPAALDSATHSADEPSLMNNAD